VNTLAVTNKTKNLEIEIVIKPSKRNDKNVL
jgi:hypothetical protein